MLVACGRLPGRVLKTIKIETWIDTEPDHISKRDTHQTIKFFTLSAPFTG